MAEYLKHYKMKIHTLSPLFIGCNQELGKSEYIYLDRSNKVIVPDIYKMYQTFRFKHLEQAYTDYIMQNAKDGLAPWLKKQGFRPADFEQWKKYELNAGDAMINSKDGREANKMKIQCFIKDPYGNPYIPGSTIKGMIRTALLCYEIKHNPKKYEYLLEDLKSEIRNPSRRDRKSYVARQVKQIESEVFHTLDYKDVRKDNAINCNLSGLIVGDSDPIPTSQLVLGRRIDVFLDGGEKQLPIFREMIKPETEITFDLTIDSSVKGCPYTIDDIMAALDEFQEISYKYFYSRFNMGINQPGTVWIGGGVGFLSKTLIYPLFEEQGYRLADSIFKISLGRIYGVHHHDRDASLGISPHACKCTRYNGRIYEMGMARMEVVE